MRSLLISPILVLIAFAIALADPQISVVPATFDFGIVPLNADLFRKFVVKSTGDVTLRIDSVTTTCDCIKIPWTKRYLVPGDSEVIELSYNSQALPGEKNRYPHIYYNGEVEAVRLAVKSFVIDDIPSLDPIYVKPFRIVASQFGDSAVTRFPFKIFNKSDEAIPLKLVSLDTVYFNLDFPGFIPPSGTAEGWLILSAEGVKSEFRKSITFEFVDKDNLTREYSIPVSRKIFRKSD